MSTILECPDCGLHVADDGDGRAELREHLAHTEAYSAVWSPTVEEVMAKARPVERTERSCEMGRRRLCHAPGAYRIGGRHACTRHLRALVDAAHSAGTPATVEAVR